MSDSESGPANKDTKSMAEVVAEVTARMMEQFSGRVALEVIKGTVAAEAARHADARITSFVPVLVERQA